MNKKWEIVYEEDWDAAEVLAAAGWEFVSVTVAAYHDGFGPSIDYRFYFKRQVPGKPAPST